MSAENAIVALSDSKNRLEWRVTLPEGVRLSRALAIISESTGIPLADLEAVADPAVYGLNVPTGSLEGYLFPDTYTFPVGTSARQVVAAMVARFERAWLPEWDARLAALGRTRPEVVTLASIVEKEVRLVEEAPVVAAVYWNRLRIGMPLQADPTVIYALGRPTPRVMYADLEVKSPYNTYRNPGLPPGPIAAPGAAALAATVHPAQVPYRYFVAHPNGHHEFRTTYREHLQAIREVRAQARTDSDRRAQSTPEQRPDSVSRAGRDSSARDRSAGARGPTTPASGRGGA
jgi:UPF0755 protein